MIRYKKGCEKSMYSKRESGCMAHRGWSGKAPENTMSAFQLAFDHPEVQAIECDVQLTKDGIPVVIHDFTIDRTTNGTGWVKDYLHKDLITFDAGGWFHSSFAGERIPSLEDVLQAARGKCQVNIELKTAGDLYPELERIIVELVVRLGMEKEVCLTSFDHEMIKRVGAINSQISTGLIISGMPLLLEEQLKEARASIVSIDYSFLTHAFVQKMLQLGVTIIAWTVNEPWEVQHVKSISPLVQICTNFPENVVGE